MDAIEKLRDLDRSLSDSQRLKIADLIEEQRERLIQFANAFDAVVDGTDIRRAKPDPEVFLKAAELLAVEPSVCLVVEDSQSGLQAAIAANIPHTIGGYSRTIRDITLTDAP